MEAKDKQMGRDVPVTTEIQSLTRRGKAYRDNFLVDTEARLIAWRLPVG